MDSGWGSLTGGKVCAKKDGRGGSRAQKGVGKGGKRMQIAYIAGPYRAKTKLGIIRNILKARKIAKKYWRKGYAVFCPHLNSALMDRCAPEEVFLRGDLEFLKYADILVVIPGWERSKGTLGEIEFAKAKGIPIIYEG